MDTVTDTRKLGREAVDSLPPARASLLVEAVLTEKKQSVGEGETKGETHGMLFPYQDLSVRQRKNVWVYYTHLFSKP